MPSWSDLGGLSGKLPESPYQSLSAFKEEDTDFFFGREQFVNELLASVQTQSFIPIVGASGSGKSSIVFAGLVPRLRQLGNIEIISFRPGNNPLGNLAVALNHDYSRLTQFTNNRDDNAKHLVLIADQFEELYTLAPLELRQPFLDALIYAINHAPKFTLILTLRSNFYGHALSYRPFSDALQQKTYNLAPLNREELRCVIEKPAQKMKVELEKGLTETLIKDLGNELGRLPLLELTLTKLWQKQKKWFLTHEAYQKIGGLQTVLVNYADTVLDKLSQYDKKRAEKIFIQLVRPGEDTEDTRRVATKKDVGERNWDLVQQLADARLLVTNRVETCKGIEETVEIIHEALIKEWGTLHQWIQNNRQFRTWQERLRGAIWQWQEMQQDKEALLRGALLLKAEEKLKERPDDLTQYEQDYIQQSIELRRRL
ncbi:WD-repeat protein [Calothrix sp. NIES-4071]|nr:WD-repeat protein [Calothrix sp. NIES-4071]BAZ55120.1 WD-repeat protein [Calothrix sp. NIES-4105]